MGLKEKLGKEKFEALLECRYNKVLNRAREGRLSEDEADKVLSRIEESLGYVPEVHLRLGKVHYWEK